MCDKSLEFAIHRVIKNHTNLTISNGNINYEIYPNYNVCLDTENLTSVLKSITLNL